MKVGSPVNAVEGAAALVNAVQVPQRLRQRLLLDAIHCRLPDTCNSKQQGWAGVTRLHTVILLPTGDTISVL